MDRQGGSLGQPEKVRPPGLRPQLGDQEPEHRKPDPLHRARGLDPQADEVDLEDLRAPEETGTGEVAWNRIEVLLVVGAQTLQQVPFLGGDRTHEVNYRREGGARSRGEVVRGGGPLDSEGKGSEVKRGAADRTGSVGGDQAGR